ncbi:rRNA maturation RNase YbeY [Silvibacterium sp.]|uniref:rRNA maturation RNase YbeY n=1 Tax=Silvibacterium sp. TaxID=1964179 RepID=UPI0039E27E8A
MIDIDPSIEEKFGRTALKPARLRRFLVAAQTEARLKGEVSVLLTGDTQIRQLNRNYRKKDKATDVLSFPADEMGQAMGIAGDLAISVETAAREAESRGHALVIELEVLLLHGALHLAGYDHEVDGGEMARKEERLRKKLGLEVGLIARTLSPAVGKPGPTKKAVTKKSVVKKAAKKIAAKKVVPKKAVRKQAARSRVR